MRVCVDNNASPVAGKKRKSDDNSDSGAEDELVMSQINPSMTSAKRQRLADQAEDMPTSPSHEPNTIPSPVAQEDLSSSDTSESTIPPSWLTTHNDDEPASSNSSDSTIPPSWSIEHKEADHTESVLPPVGHTDSMLESKYDSQSDYYQQHIQQQQQSNDDASEIIRSVSSNNSHQQPPQQHSQQQQHSSQQQQHSSQQQRPSQRNSQQAHSQQQQQQHRQQNTHPTLITPLSIANHPKLLRKIPFANKNIFITTMQKLWRQYTSASLDTNHTQQHQIIAHILSIPGQALRSRRGGKKDRNREINHMRARLTEMQNIPSHTHNTSITASLQSPSRPITRSISSVHSATNAITGR
jgi:hypothetical protein